MKRLSIRKAIKINLLLPILLILPLLAGCSKPPEGMVEIPKGEAIKGSNETDTEGKAIQYGNKKPWFLNEHPQHKVTVEEFYIDKFEVTNSDYREFTQATGHRTPSDWDGGSFDANDGDKPVTMVSWFDAKAYCKWKSKRLPTETEWEKAARGTDGRRFPWGNDFDLKKLNTMGMHGGTVTIGTFEDGKSPYGLYDMSGNVQEWVLDSYLKYPDSDYEDKDFGERFKVVRGGGWGGIGHYASEVYVRSAYRNYAPPGATYNDVGFRCAW
jgi:formylglycine-generating enzyme required for sulfatase activity